MPIGLRGVGKTVLLNRFAEIAEDEGLAVSFIEASDQGDFRVLLVNRLRRSLLGFERGRAGPKVLRALRILKTFTYQLPDGAQIALDVDALRGEADSGNLSDDLTDVLVAAGEAALDRSSGILLAIDEVQYLSGQELAALISAIHRTVQLDLPVVLVGAGLPQLPGLSGDAKSYAERLFEFPPIGPLSDDDARAALLIPAQSEGADYTGGALDAVLGAAQGYPYFLQEWGYRTWNAADGPAITADDVHRVSASVVEHLDQNFFRVRFDRLTPAEKKYLRGMATLGPGPHRSGDIAAEFGVRVESVAPRRSSLITKGMLWSPAHGDTAFTVPLFDQFLRRTVVVE